MIDIQECKFIVLKFLEELEAASADNIDRAIEEFAGPDYRCRGVHPFDEIVGPADVAGIVWQPMRAAFTLMQRRQDIFMAGPNRIDGTIWVMSMGKYLGLFDNDWLGIPSTGKIALIPYCEFHRVHEGRIAESALWLDVVSVMQQAGLDPLPMQTGAKIINPGPRTSDGLLFEAQDHQESKKTLNLMMAMCDKRASDDMRSSADDLARFWHDEMIWFGPSGIGATYTIGRYQEQHQGPFRAGLEEIEFNGHVLEHAEGNYGASFGWPSLTIKQGEGFLGLPASDRPAEMRAVDVYRRDGGKLVENWVFIDVLHYLLLLGVDVLERCRTISRA